jgi:hypothetical protein
MYRPFQVIPTHQLPIGLVQLAGGLGHLLALHIPDDAKIHDKWLPLTRCCIHSHSHPGDGPVRNPVGVNIGLLHLDSNAIGQPVDARPYALHSITRHPVRKSSEEIPLHTARDSHC